MYVYHLVFVTLEASAKTVNLAAELGEGLAANAAGTPWCDLAHLWAYACAHVCMHACVGMHVCMCGHACVHVCMCAYVHVCMCGHACVYVCTCARVHVCACVHVCMCARVHVCTCVRACVRTHTHIEPHVYGRQCGCTSTWACESICAMHMHSMLSHAQRTCMYRIGFEPHPCHRCPRRVYSLTHSLTHSLTASALSLSLAIAVPAE